MNTKFYLLLIMFGLTSRSIAQTTVTFTVIDMPAVATDVVGIRGNVPPLSWEESYIMEQEDGEYVSRITFPQGSDKLEFKFVYQKSTDSGVTWEGIDNRKVALSESVLDYSGIWDEPLYQDPATFPLLTVEALQADYALIETIFREVHPGTYRYLTEEELTANLAVLKEKFSTPLTMAEAYLILNEFTATIRCGHTASPLYNQSSAVTSMLFYGPDKLPFTFRWRDGKMIVHLDATADNILPRGSEVVSIDGHSATDILKTLRAYVPSDGPAVNPKDGMLSLRGYPWRQELFDAGYHLAFPVEQTGISLKFIPADGVEMISATVSPLRRRERAAVLAERYPEHPQKADDLWKLDLSDDRVAVLTVGDFTGFGKGALTLDYEAFFAEAFARIKAAGVEKLIIDVRENEGGNDPIVNELLSYLEHPQPKEIFFEGRMRYRSFPEVLRPYVKTWGSSVPAFFEPEKGDLDESGRYYVYPKAFTRSHRMKVKKGTFSGEVVFLTERINASLGFYLAHYVRHNEVGTLIGTTTAGCQRGINGGNLALLRLPNTDLEIDFPVLGGFALEEVPAIGIVPDISVTITAEDDAAGSDPVLEAAKAYLYR